MSSGSRGYRELAKVRGRIGGRAAALLAALSAGDARGDAVAQRMESKGLAPASLAVVDPETGSSTGTGTTDAKVSPGDILIFRLRTFPVPDKLLHGLQGYVTEYVPPNTEVVGVRLVGPDGLAVAPRLSGIATDGCGRPCNGFDAVPCATGTCNLDDGSISQLYADTGIFYTTDSRLTRDPDDSFLTVENGILMNPEPINADAIRGLLEIDSGASLFSHNPWDWIQVRAFGVAGAASGNNGNGNTPFRYGSPVAGPGAYYDFEATEVAPGTIEFNDVTGPWQRIAYPGSQIGSGAAVSGDGPLLRMGVDTAAGFDLRPNNPLPAGTRAIRVAHGEVRIGEPVVVDVALRVLATPLDPVQNADVNCAEVFGGDGSAANATVRADHNPWRTALASPACAYLNTLLEHTIDRPYHVVAENYVLTVHGKNLSRNTHTNAVVRQKFNSNKAIFVSATGGPALVPDCDGDGLTCLVWPALTLRPSDEYRFESTFQEPGIGSIFVAADADYRSDQLGAPGYTARVNWIRRAVPIVRAALQCDSPFAPAGGTANLSGTIANAGTDGTSYDTLTLIMPSGWAVFGDVTLDGTPLVCNTGCGTNQPEYAIADALDAGESRALAFAAVVPIGTAPGLYPVDLQIWASVAGFGGSYETHFRDAAWVPVGEPRSPPPVVTGPIPSSATSISGTTSEPDGTIIRLYFDGILRASAIAAGGVWTVAGLDTSFGPLYGGLEVRATADGPSALESVRSAASFVTAAAVCTDAIDNDGDGLTDYPADPGCAAPADADETDPVYECSDTTDNDLDGLTDHPADPSCAGDTDDDESGPPQCSDGADNDGDGLTDHPADPGCDAAGDATEVDLRACENGADDDLDGPSDFPADPGCHSANDDDETDEPPFDPTGGLRARVLIAFGTSGSMNTSACEDRFTGGDGSIECPGADVPCAVCAAAPCGNAAADDSRLHKVRQGVSDAARAYGEIDFGLMRFHQRAVQFRCPRTDATGESGGWQGARAAPCSGGFSAGDLLVGFSDDDADDLLEYMDGTTNYPGTPPEGRDRELRGTGKAPLSGLLASAQAYVDAVRASDPGAACRPYRVLLATDGLESCGGDPVGTAAALCAAGIPVDVVGFTTPNPEIQATLDAIADAGCDASCDPDYGGPEQVCRDTAIPADDEDALSTAIGRIVSSSIFLEQCNGLDDDCDGLTDEEFPGVLPPPGADCDNGELGACFRTGHVICLSVTASGCDAPSGTPVPESCDGVDNDCNGLTDEPCIPCIPGVEICNGQDDDCDSLTDEPFVLGEGAVCGIDTGECSTGTLVCTGGALDCDGDNGPTPETCNNLDDDCDGRTDGFVQECYTFGDGGCTPGVGCTGRCRMGVEVCTAGSLGACQGDFGGAPEVCNGTDDDCDTETDEGFLGLGQPCDNGLLGICAAPGFITCSADGLSTLCNAPILWPSPTGEICNDVDDDCDGEFNENLGSPVGDACGGMLCGGTVVCICDPSPPALEHTNCVLNCVGEGVSLEVCDNRDNDCDGFTDETPLPDVGVMCSDYPQAGIGACVWGETTCVAGEIECSGDIGPSAGSCNGQDDDCDGQTDGGGPSDSLCAPGQLCYSGACLSPCDEASFPCPSGFVCLPYVGEDYCFPDPCIGNTCPPGEFPDVADPETCVCVDPCDFTDCPADTVCVEGNCLDCHERSDVCADDAKCVRDSDDDAWICVTDPCADVRCGDGESCIDGECTRDCDPACPDGQLCTQGTCCEVDTAVCEGTACGPGLACNPDDGTCIPDPCVFAHCAPGRSCAIGCEGRATCLGPDRPDQVAYVLLSGEGGCACSLGAPPTMPPPWLLVLAAALAALRIGSRPGRRS